MSTVDDKAKKIASDLGWNILAVFLGILFVNLLPTPISYFGWLMVIMGAIGGLACLANVFLLDQQAEEQEKVATMKQCPACAEDIKIAARKCKHCGEILF